MSKEKTRWGNLKDCTAKAKKGEPQGLTKKKRKDGAAVERPVRAKSAGMERGRRRRKAETRKSSKL